MLDWLFYDNKELSNSDVSEEMNGGDASYLKDSPLDGNKLFSLSEVVSEIPVVWNKLLLLCSSSTVSTALDPPEVDGEWKSWNSQQFRW